MKVAGTATQGWNKRVADALPLSLALSLQLIYLTGAQTFPNHLFGINQLHWLDPGLRLVSLILIWPLAYGLVRYVHGWWPPNGRLSDAAAVKVLLAGLVSVISPMGFLAFRNRFVNPDGLSLLQLVARDVPERGAFLTYDSPMESFIHSKFWYYTNSLFGWDVRQSYHALSALAGGPFVLTVLVFALLSGMRRWGLFLVLFFSGGFMQLFFGDIEHYAWVSLLLLAYLVSAYFFIWKRMSLIIPCILISVAMSFHLLAAWLLPSTAYLVLIAFRRGKHVQAVLGISAGVAILGALAIYFNSSGLPISQLFSKSHAFGLARGEFSRYLNLGQTDVFYFFEVFNLLLLLYPAMLVIPFLLVTRKIMPSRENKFLGICLASSLLFALIWNFQLGVYNDWNLFAPFLIPAALLVSWNVSQTTSSTKHDFAYVAFALTALLHSLAWILSNHFAQNY